MCPIQGLDAKVNQNNLFGANPSLYKGIQFNGKNLSGHEGIDLIVPVGTPLFSPIEGIATVKDTGSTGYGKHIIITNDRFKIYLGHLSEVFIKTGDPVSLLSLLGKSGNSGNSRGAHLHITVVRLKDGKILNLDNGYGGAVDVSEFIVTWQGSITKDLIS